MIIKIVFLLFSFLLIIQDCLSKSLKRLDNDYGEVIFVTMLYRHGERTPIDPYPNDPYRNLSYWPCDWGQLTNAGKLSHYNLGNWLRIRYSHLIPGGRYNNKVVYVQSTDVDRTLMSAEANLAGMFPPSLKDRWGNIRWQPIPVHTVPETSDKLVAMNAPCKRYDEAFEHAMSSPEMIRINKKYKDLYDQLTQYTGKVIKDLDGLVSVYSNLFIESMANFTLPNWTRKIFPDELVVPAGLSFTIPTFTKKLKRLKAGPLVKEIITQMFQKRDDKLIRNLTIYSGHDITVGNLLNTLGVYNDLPPPFTALVLLELRRNFNNEHFVTVLYKNFTGNPHVLTLPGCAEACPLDKTKFLLNDVIPEDWDSECHSHDLFDVSNGQPYHSLAIFDDVNNLLVGKTPMIPVVYQVD